MNKTDKIEKEFIKAIKTYPQNAELYNDYAMFLYRFKNDYITASNFKKKLIENVFNYGNGLVKIERDLNNNITALYLCDSTKFSCKYNQITNIPTYYYMGKQIDITDYLLIYFYADSATNGYSGIPLKQYAMNVLKKINTVENFESNYFNGNAITGILSPTTPDRPLPQQQAEKAKKEQFGIPKEEKIPKGYSVHFNKGTNAYSKNGNWKPDTYYITKGYVILQKNFPTEDAAVKWVQEYAKERTKPGKIRFMPLS